MERYELEDREEGVLEEPLPESMLAEFVASSEFSQMRFGVERHVLDASIEQVEELKLRLGLRLGGAIA